MDSAIGSLGIKDGNSSHIDVGDGLEAGYEFSSFESWENSTLDLDVFESASFGSAVRVCNSDAQFLSSKHDRTEGAISGKVSNSKNIIRGEKELDAFDHRSGGYDVLSDTQEFPAIHGEKFGYSIADLPPKDDYLSLEKPVDRSSDHGVALEPVNALESFLGSAILQPQIDTSGMDSVKKGSSPQGPQSDIGKMIAGMHSTKEFSNGDALYLNQRSANGRDGGCALSAEILLDMGIADPLAVLQNSHYASLSDSLEFLVEPESTH
eukprot:IDg2137t1